jgi:hypothetical protein
MTPKEASLYRRDKAWRQDLHIADMMREVYPPLAAGKYELSQFFLFLSRDTVSTLSTFSFLQG